MFLSDSEKEKIIEICKRNDVEYCAVFGSFARGDATADSDVDLLVRFSNPVGYRFFDVALELEASLGKEVDMATDKMIGLYIRESVMRDIKTIYEKTERPAQAPAYS